jgi:periodic tryptophan protein 1
VQWHGSEAWLLASAGYDKHLALSDCRTAHTTIASALPSDVESLAWDPFSPYHLYVSLEDGSVLSMDIRNPTTHRSTFTASGISVNPYIRWKAHEKTVTSLHFSSAIKGMLATASLDKSVKLWDINSVQEADFRQIVSDKTWSATSTSSGRPSPRCVAYKSMNVGKLFSLRFSYDEPFLLATAGDKGKVAVWESDEMEIIAQHFGNRRVPVRNPYLGSLSEEGEESSGNKAERLDISIANDAAITGAARLGEEDMSWMDDNSGIAGNNGGASGDTEKKKKKKKKVAK